MKRGSAGQSARQSDGPGPVGASPRADLSGLVSLFADAIDQSRDLIFILDAERRIVAMSSGLAERLGYSSNELLGHHCYERVHGTVAPPDDCTFTDLLLGEVGQSTEVHSDALDGDFVISVTSIRDKEGRLLGAAHLATDISERIRLEQALREQTTTITSQRDTLRGIIESADGPVFSVDTDYLYTSFNAQHAAVMKALYGTSIRLGRSLLECQTVVEDRAMAKADLDRALQGETVRGEAYSGDNGSRRYFLVSHMPIWGAHRKVAGVAVYARDDTARKEAQDAVGESEVSHRELVDHLNSGVVVYEATAGGADFIIREFNGAAERIERIRMDDVLGRLVTEAFPGVGDMGLLAVLQRVWESGRPEHQTASYYEDERGLGWRENYVYRLPSGGVVAVYDDVTDRVRAEQDLREGEARYRALAETSPDFIYVIDREDRIRCVNGKAAASVGRSSEELVGELRAGLFSGETGARMEGDLRHVFETGEPLDVDSRLEYPTGERWISTSLVPMKDDGGCVETVFGVSRDITERKRAADMLSRYSLLAAEARDIILFVRAADGAIVEANVAAEVAYGYSRGELLGLDITQLRSARDGPTIDKQVRAAGTEGILFETEHHRKDGSAFPVEVSSRGTTMVDGQKVLLSVIRDISERKQAEQALVESAVQLKLTLKAAVSAPGAAIELRDPYTGGHQRRVARLACAIAAELG